MSQEAIARRRFVRLLALAALVAGSPFALAGCGKRAPLKPPPDEEDDFGHQYPDPSQE